MNAVSRYGARQIGETGKVDFFYNEVWADEADFTNLKAILYENGVYGNYQLNTVFAAYMNYNKADNRGEFNTPGILRRMLSCLLWVVRTLSWEAITCCAKSTFRMRT